MLFINEGKIKTDVFIKEKNLPSETCTIKMWNKVFRLKENDFI